MRMPARTVAILFSAFFVLTGCSRSPEKATGDAGEMGEPDAGDIGEPDAGDIGEPDAGDDGEPDAGDVSEPDAGDGGDAEVERVCEPGETKRCFTGPEGAEGVGICKAGEQECRSDGTGFGSCLGQTLPSRDDCDGDDCSQACLVCEPGSTLGCYTGPEGSEGVGICTGGVRQCQPDGLGYGACVGEVLPAREDCDEDDCAQACLHCRPGFALPCYTGPTGTAGVGICRVGQQHCKPDGMSFGSCADEVLPTRDACDGDDCSQACLVCEPGAEVDCYTGPEGTEDIGICKAGKRKCLPDGQGYGACLTQTVPTQDDCDGDDCSQACLRCSPGSNHACYTGPEGTEGVGICKSGTKECNGEGLGFGECVGEQHPTAEVCGLDDCDNACRGPVCGNGVLEFGEACDAGEENGHFACSSTCTFQPIRQLAAGDDHTCALLHDRTIKCWGRNNVGQLGLGHPRDVGTAGNQMGDKLPRVDLGWEYQAVQVVAGSTHTCALLSDGYVKCWGGNQVGQIGSGSAQSIGAGPFEMGDDLSPLDLGEGVTVKAIAAGSTHTCALLNDDTVKCWGANASGQLGLGDKATRGRGGFDMGDLLGVVKLGGDDKAKSIAAGGAHSCALLHDDTVKCWGANDVGQLGLGHTNEVGTQAAHLGDAMQRVDLGEGVTVKALTAGRGHGCALLSDDTARCWGANSNGELGLGNTVNRGDGGPLGAMGDDLPAVRLGGHNQATAIEAGKDHTCAVLTDGTSKCWGLNRDGQLGTGDELDRGDKDGNIGDGLDVVHLGGGDQVKAIAPGGDHSCALLADDTVKCWGRGAFGQLGLGAQESVGGDEGQMGNDLPRLRIY